VNKLTVPIRPVLERPLVLAYGTGFSMIA